MKCLPAILITSLFVISASAADAPLAGWGQVGRMTVLTTADGANLPAGAVIEGFPLLVRLNKDGFDFAQARPDGADVRLTTADGTVLPHQIEQWDAESGSASLWVRVPRIEGHARLPLLMHWGNAGAPSTSSASDVFHESNGYLGVWHMDGALTPDDTHTKSAPGVIGAARQFSGNASVRVADKLTGYPTGHEAHTTEMWFRAEQSGSSVLGWGKSEPQGKVVMQLRGPPHIRMDCWFSEGSLESEEVFALSEWQHAAFVYEKGNVRIYINGAPAGGSKRAGTPMKLTSPASLWIGGWHGEQQYRGDLDEIRISNVTRSAEWIRLQYENQKPLQTLVGPLMRGGREFAVMPEKASLAESGRARFKAEAGGAEKIYWSLVREGREQVVAVDRLHFDFDAGRVTGDASLTLRFKAVFADGVKTRDIPITVRETTPDPEFTLEAPPSWDGRTPLEIRPRVSNLAALQSAGVGEWRAAWQAGPAAVTKDALPDQLRLLAAQKNGPLTVTATLSNGGASVSRSVTMQVTQPAKPTWIEPTSEPDEKPEEGQFYARDDKHEGTLHYRGTLEKNAAEVFLKTFADDKPFAEMKARPDAQGRYALSAKLKVGLVKYRVEFGTRDGETETVLDRVGDLLCGDVFLIDGQSNAVALDLRDEYRKPRETNEWLRTYGGPMGPDDGLAWVKQHWKEPPTGQRRPNLWSKAVWAREEKTHPTWIGWWGMELGKRLIESRSVPVCIINGALGGSRIDQHQRNTADPADVSTIYGRWLWRLRQARLTHGVCGVIWHQGENDQPADNPQGRPGHENYRPLFLDMAAGWQRDLPNARHYYLFQIWPNACAMGGDKGAGDRVREAQRRLPEHFDNLSILSTLGIRPPGGCHFPKEGYSEFSRLLQPLIERDLDGRVPAAPITPPNLLRAAYPDAARDTLRLEFDQPVVWQEKLATEFYLNGEPGLVTSGSVSGNVLTLKLKGVANAKQITYLQEKKWNQDNLLLGTNGLAALTFCEVPIASP